MNVGPDGRPLCVGVVAVVSCLVCVIIRICDVRMQNDSTSAVELKTENSKPTIYRISQGYSKRDTIHEIVYLRKTNNVKMNINIQDDQVLCSGIENSISFPFV